MAENDDKGRSAHSEGNLDLTQYASDDYDALASEIENFYTTDSAVKLRLAYSWTKNSMFLDGQQWMVFTGTPETGGMWERLQTSKSNEWIPRPVTNYIFDVYQTLKSYLIKNKPRSTVRPNTQEFRDKAASKIATLCLEANWSRLCEEVNYEYAAANLVTYGTVFKKSYWDTTVAGAIPVPRMQQVPQTDPMTGQVTGVTSQPVVDEAGQPVIDLLPLGDVSTAIVEPFRIALDPSANAMHNLRWIIEYSIQSLSWIQETYGKDPGQYPGYTGNADDVKEERSLSGSLRRFQLLKNSSGRRGAINFGEGSSGGNGDALPTNSAVVKEYYEKPSFKYPKGRLVVVANHEVLYSGDSPYSGPEASDWHPYSECRWEIVPGRFWGKSPLDDATEIQKQINSIDSVVVLTRKTMVIPQKLIPIGAGIPPGSWTGRPGQEIHWRDSGRAAPSVIPGAGLDQSVFQEREFRLSDMKNTTGAIDILKGDRPPGVTAASALNLLFEVGTGKLFPVLDRWKYFVEQDQKKQLKLICKHYQEPRPDYIAMLLQKNSELDPQSINKFIGADLYDNCNVIVEAGSNIPKLQAAQQAALQEAAQLGTLGLEQPANRDEFNQRMGILGFDNDIGPDRTRAEWENDLLNDIQLSPDNAPVVLNVDMDDVHMDIHAREMKKPSFMTKPQPVQQAYMQHYVAHMQAQSQKAQTATIEAMAHGQPLQGGPQAGNQPTPIRKAGGTTPQAQRNALRSDMLQSGPIGGKT